MNFQYGVNKANGIVTAAIEPGMILEVEELNRFQSVPALAPCRPAVYEGQRYVEYGVMGYTSVEDILAYPLTRRGFLEVAKQICYAGVMMDNAGVPQQILTGADAVYLNGQGARLCYIPVQGYECAGVQGVLEDILARAAFAQNEDTSYVEDTKAYFAANGRVSMGDFWEYLMCLERGEQVRYAAPAPQAAPAGETMLISEAVAMAEQEKAARQAEEARLARQNIPVAAPAPDFDEKARQAAEEAHLAAEAEARRMDEARAAEEARRAEEARIAQEEAARAAEEARQQEEARLAEEARRAEEARIAEEEAARAAAEEARRQEELRLAEEARIAAEELARQQEEERLAEEARLAAEEEAKRQEELRLAEEAKQQEEARLAEETRIAQEEAARAAAEEEKRQEEQRFAEAEQRRLEEERRLEADRLEEEARLEAMRIENERIAEEKRLAEEARRAEEARLAEEARAVQEAEARKAEELYRAEQERQSEAARHAQQAYDAEEARRSEMSRLEEETRRQEEARMAAISARREAEERLIREARERQIGIKPMLVLVRTGERILVDRPLTRIGRKAEAVDFCVRGNPAVGRHHGDIIVRDNQYYYVDGGSLNHSYINGMMARPGQEVLLNLGDRIVLANEELRFVPAE